MIQILSPEDAVRNYLLSLDDPTRLIDADQISKLEEAMRVAVDPIDKLKALAALTRAREPDIQSYEQDFVRHAQAWAETNDIPAATFAELGVPKSVLQSAGLVGGRKINASATNASKTKPVSANAIRDQILSWEPRTFTFAEVASTIGGSPMTIRKAADELVKAGAITKLGPTPNWNGRGRAPIQYNRTRSR